MLLNSDKLFDFFLYFMPMCYFAPLHYYMKKHIKTCSKKNKAIPSDLFLYWHN